MILLLRRHEEMPFLIFQFVQLHLDILFGLLNPLSINMSELDLGCKLCLSSCPRISLNFLKARDLNPILIH